MEQVSQKPSVEEISRITYDRYDELYRPFFTDRQHVVAEVSLHVTDETTKMLRFLPEEHESRLYNFAQRVTECIPEAIFSNQEYHPAHRIGLKTILAHVYKIDEGSTQEPSNRELYIRALTALSDSSLYFSYGYRANTEVVIDNFSSGDFTREGFYNFLLQLTAQTMPFATVVTEKRNEDIADYNSFMQHVQARYHNAMETLVDYCHKYAPDKVRTVQSWVNDIVLVHNTRRQTLFTNDEKLRAMSEYNDLPAAGVADGIDPISGLPLTVCVMPWDYRKIVENPDIPQAENPAFKLVLKLIHEDTHNIPPSLEFSGSYMYLVNELLTDATAWIVTLKSEGRDFVDIPDENRARQGYVDLVSLARSLIKNNFFTQDEIVELGFKQDPQTFLHMLSERVQACEDMSSVEDIVSTLRKTLLIEPRRGEDVPRLVEEFSASPSLFLQNELMKMWELVGGTNYLGLKTYMLETKDRYMVRHPEVTGKTMSVVLDEDGCLIDEAVDIFHQVMKERTETSLAGFPLLSEEKLDSQLESAGDAVDFTAMDVPEQLVVHAADKRALLMSVNVILQKGLVPTEMSDEDRFKLIVQTSATLYERTIKLLEDRWRAHGIEYSRDDVLRLYNEVVPTWLLFGEQVKTPTRLIEKILSGFEGMTHPVDTPDGEFILKPEDAFYWGRSLS